MDIKGMALDDTTMQQCGDKILGVWPNTKTERVKSLRLFAAWKSYWGGDPLRKEVWGHLLNFTKNNGVKVLLGVDTTTDQNENEKQMQWGLELMKQLEKDQIMGFSFGNEMLVKKGIDWDTVFPWVQEKIRQIDSAGFTDVKVTLVWSMGVLPRIQKKDFPFLDNMYKQYLHRWVWAVNPYSIWDAGLHPTSPSDCKSKTATAVGIDCLKSVMTAFRKAVNAFTGNTDDPLWIGETGWSSPFPGSLQQLQQNCQDFCSVTSLRKYYQNFLEWDGSLNDGLKGPDQIFYFTNRDAPDLRDFQPFGLVKQCSDSKCKIQSGAQAENVLV